MVVRAEKSLPLTRRLEVRDEAGERRRLSLRQIEVFRAVMISGSINGASQMLRVSQPSLSRVVKRTEDVLGFKLFERGRGRIIPTKEAGALLALVSGVYRQLDELGDTVDRLTKGDGGQFRLGCTGGPGRCLVPRTIAAMHRILPELSFQIDVLLFEQIIDYLIFQRGECVVSIFPIRHPLVQSRLVATGRLVALIPKNHALARCKRVSVRELANESLISFLPETPHGAILLQMFHSERLSPRIGVLIRHIETAIGLVANGVGIAIVDEFSVADTWNIPISVVPVKDSTPLHIYVSCHKDIVRSHFFSRFEKVLVSILSASQRPASATDK